MSASNPVETKPEKAAGQRRRESPRTSITFLNDFFVTICPRVVAAAGFPCITTCSKFKMRQHGASSRGISKFGSQFELMVR
jgi:hypothetical protein